MVEHAGAASDELLNRYQNNLADLAAACAYIDELRWEMTQLTKGAVDMENVKRAQTNVSIYHRHWLGL